MILVCVKAYDTDTAAQSIQTMISDTTVVISLQNGVDNAERLISVLDSQHVLGGLCSISSFVAEPGVIEQVSEFARIVFGELDGQVTLSECGYRNRSFYQHPERDLDQVPVHRDPRQHDRSDALAHRSDPGHACDVGDVRQRDARGRLSRAG